MSFSYFARLRSRKPKRTVEIEDILNSIIDPSDDVMAIVTAIRETTDDDEIQALKKKLPGFTVSGKFEIRDEDSLLEHTGMYVYDIDEGLGTASKIKSAKQKLVEEIPSLVAAFTSPSGKGLKIILQGPVAHSNHNHVWQVGKKLIEEAGLIVDKSGSDVCRLCFMSVDPDLVESDGAFDAFTVSKQEVQSEKDDEDDDEDVDGLFEDDKKTFLSYNSRIIQEMLWAIGSDIPYDDWRNVIWGVVSRLGKKPYVKEMLLEWSTKLGGKRSLSNVKEFEAIYKNKKEGVTLATTIKLANEAGWVNWRSMLQRDEEKKAIIDDSNLNIILENHPDFKGRLWANEITGNKTLEPRENPMICTKSRLGGVIDDSTAYEVLCDIQGNLNYGYRSVRQVITSMIALANRHSRNPRREWLESLKWDGKKRMHRLFIDGFNAEDLERNEAISKAFICGAVARIIKPGSSVQVVPILVGKQGTGKSSGVRALCPEAEWFCDSFINMNDKSAYEVAMQSSIIELAELSGIRHSELERVKQFVTQRVVRFREPYGRVALDRPVTWVFIGTTNEEEFLKDHTGNRRWAPVKIRDIDEESDLIVDRTVKYVMKHRDQLWAEAYDHVIKGMNKGVENWHLDKKYWAEFEQVTERAIESDPWQEFVEVANLKEDTPFTMKQISDECGIRINTRVDMLRLARCLRRLGWDKHHTRHGKRWILSSF